MITGQRESSTTIPALIEKMQAELRDGLLTFGGFVVLLVDGAWYEYMPGSSPSNSLPGWSVTILVLSGSAFLCWVGYTVQCRRMVLDLEKEYTEGKGSYSRLPRKKHYDET
eukprot:TRINITY_DN5450_c0_g1_i4.p2 TRINITY_DN5450_c0_g1~~TRINITY_DN5450_c0_g1_i4.p2  ORF type:complete len:111 (+),score=31.07 TRINITY_DN5450_c0_g1_i4:528-860(+)